MMNNLNETILDLLAKFQAKHTSSAVSPIRLVKRAIYSFEHRRWSYDHKFLAAALVMVGPQAFDFADLKRVATKLSGVQYEAINITADLDAFIRVCADVCGVTPTAFAARMSNCDFAFADLDQATTIPMTDRGYDHYAKQTGIVCGLLKGKSLAKVQALIATILSK